MKKVATFSFTNTFTCRRRCCALFFCRSCSAVRCLLSFVVLLRALAVVVAGFRWLLECLHMTYPLLVLSFFAGCLQDQVVTLGGLGAC